MIQRKMGMVCGVVTACWVALCVSAAEPEVGPRLTDEQFFVLNGDTFYQMDFGDLSRVQQEKNLEMALVLRGVRAGLSQGP